MKKTHSRMSEKLKKTLEERIVTGQYLPGMRLDETELATEFSVSRTPVREALIQLAFYGLIEMRPRRGAVVTDVSPQTLYEMFEVMSELEALSAKLAARRHNEADLKNILDAQTACEKAFESGDVDDYYLENERFHMAIFAASHNSFLNQKATSLFRRLGVYRRLQLRIRGRLKTSRDEHAEVVNALIAGNSELAAEHLRNHVIVQGELFSDLIASMSSHGMRSNQA